RVLPEQVGVRIRVPHLLSIVLLQIPAFVRRRGHAVEVSDDAHADGPEVRGLLEHVRDGIPAVAGADGSASIGGPVSLVHEPSNVRYRTSFPSANSPVGNLPRRLSTRTRPLLPEAATRRSGVVNVE